jgi:hypothetical protein
MKIEITDLHIELYAKQKDLLEVYEPYGLSSAHYAVPTIQRVYRAAQLVPKQAGYIT